MALRWVVGNSPHPIPADMLARVMLLGSATTLPDGSVVTDRPHGPQAHLATQGSGTAPLPTHFHGVDQFQYFTDGSGTVGTHRVARGVVHYTDRLTVYGPLRPGADGMSYLALRPDHDPGASFMPQSRRALSGLLKRSPRPASDRHNLTFELYSQQCPEHGEWTHLVHEREGLRVAVSVVDAGGETEPVLVAGSGAYAVVVSGEVERVGPDTDGVPGPGALAWCSQGETFTIRAAADSTRLALLQFPEPARETP
jgi:hypothetical protein